MAIRNYFNRDTRFFVKMGAAIWEVPILVDYSFSQATEVTEITLNEAEDATGSSIRGKAAFNDALNPVEWSVSTYIRPKVIASGNFAGNSLVDEVLWAALMGANSYVASAGGGRTAGDFINTITGRTPEVQVNIDKSAGIFSFAGSNRSTLGEIELFFVLGPSVADSAKRVIKIERAIVNEATITFDIDGIAMVSWSGFGARQVDFSSEAAPSPRAIVSALRVASNVIKLPTAFTDETTTDSVVLSNAPLSGVTSQGTSNLVIPAYSLFGVSTGIAASGEDGDDSVLYAPIRESVDSTTNLLRNRVTQLVVSPDLSFAGQSSLQASYSMTLTGGSITISNNVNYLTPEELGKVNQPLAGITGTRSISGEINCYMRFEDSVGGSALPSSHNFWQDMSGLTNVIQNKVNLEFRINRSTAPYVHFRMNRCHVDIPTQSIEDVISLTTTFNALPSTIGQEDELTMLVAGA